MHYYPPPPPLYITQLMHSASLQVDYSHTKVIISNLEQKFIRRGPPNNFTVHRTIIRFIRWCTKGFCIWCTKGFCIWCTKGFCIWCTKGFCIWCTKGFCIWCTKGFCIWCTKGFCIWCTKGFCIWCTKGFCIWCTKAFVYGAQKAFVYGAQKAFVYGAQKAFVYGAQKVFVYGAQKAFVIAAVQLLYIVCFEFIISKVCTTSSVSVYCKRDVQCIPCTVSVFQCIMCTHCVCPVHNDVQILIVNVQTYFIIYWNRIITKIVDKLFPEFFVHAQVRIICRGNKLSRN